MQVALDVARKHQPHLPSIVENEFDLPLPVLAVIPQSRIVLLAIARLLSSILMGIIATVEAEP